MSDDYTPAPVDTPTDIPTQIAYPARAILRTFIQWLVGLALAWLLKEYGLDLSGMSDTIVTLVFGLVWALGTALATWIMTRPVVVRFLAGTLLAPKP